MNKIQYFLATNSISNLGPMTLWGPKAVNVYVHDHDHEHVVVDVDVVVNVDVAGRQHSKHARIRRPRNG